MDTKGRWNSGGIRGTEFGGHDTEFDSNQKIHRITR